MYKFILPILTGLILLTACGEKNAATTQSEQTLTVKGSLKNANVPSVVIFKDAVVSEAQLGPDKSFSTSFTGTPGYYEIILGRQRLPIYLKGGGDLIANLDMRNARDLSKFEGEGAGETTYLLAKELVRRKIQGAARKTYALPEEEFTAELEKNRSDYINLLNQHEGLDKSFIANEKKNVDFSIKAFAQDYQEAFRYFTNAPDYKVSQAFTDAYSHSDFDNEELFKNIPEYKTLVMRNYIKPDLAASIPAIGNIQSPYIKDAIIRQVYTEIKPGFENLEQNMNNLISWTSDETLKSALSQRFNTLKSIDTGSKSPEFTYRSAKGGQVALNDLMGKNVYIDVWATWCGPCKREIPHLKKLEQEYHGKNVEFVSISVDTPDKEGKWKQMVDEQELGGTQLITGSGWDSPFIKSYMISGIPRFILLDEQGKIVSSNAPRPSSGQAIRQALNSLL